MLMVLLSQSLICSQALETFKALGIDFVSLSEHVDTSTPTGKMFLRSSALWLNSSAA